MTTFVDKRTFETSNLEAAPININKYNNNNNNMNSRIFSEHQEELSGLGGNIFRKETFLLSTNR